MESLIILACTIYDFVMNILTLGWWYGRRLDEVLDITISDQD